MELNLGVVRNFSGAFLKQRQRILIIAFPVEDPAQGVCDWRFRRQQCPGFLRQIVGFVEVAQALRVQVGEVIQRIGGLGLHRKKFLVGIPGLREVFHSLICLRQDH
jgi:hypothetical protein